MAPHAFCNLMTKYLLICDSKRLCVLNKEYKLVKVFEKFKQFTFWSKGIATDNEKSLFILDWDSHRILKIDYEFNLIGVFGSKKGNGNNQLYYPTGICYHNHSLYVCDNWNKRIQKLDANNFDFQKSFKFNFLPEKIEIVNETACIRSETEIYFVDLETFEVKCKYSRGKPGIIGKCHLKFYEYFKNLIFTYDENGDIVEAVRIDTPGLFEHITSTDGGIIMFNGKLTMGFSDERKLVVCQ